MMSGIVAPGGREGLRGAVAVAALRHHRDDVLRQARQDAGDGGLRLRLVPVAVHGADDLELRVLGDALVDALGDLVVDEHAGEAADLEQLAALRHLVLEVEDLVLAHLLEVDRDAPGAGLGHDAVEGDDGHAGVAGFLDRAVQRVRRGGVQDDRVVALQHQVLDLRGLLGHLVLGRGERIGGGDDAGLDGGLRHLVPAPQHRLPPGVSGVVVGERDLLVRVSASAEPVDAASAMAIAVVVKQ